MQGIVTGCGGMAAAVEGYHGNIVILFGACNVRLQIPVDPIEHLFCGIERLGEQ